MPKRPSSWATYPARRRAPGAPTARCKAAPIAHPTAAPPTTSSGKMRPDVRPGQAHDDGEPPHQPPPTSTQVGTCRGGQGDRDCRVTGNEPVPGVGRAAKYHVGQDRPRARPLGDPLDHLGDEPGGEPGSGQVDCQPDPATGQRSKRQRRCGQHVPQLHDHKEAGPKPAGKIVWRPGTHRSRAVAQCSRVRERRDREQYECRHQADDVHAMTPARRRRDALLTGTGRIRPRPGHCRGSPRQTLGESALPTTLVVILLRTHTTYPDPPAVGPALPGPARSTAGPPPPTSAAEFGRTGPAGLARSSG